MMYLAFLLSNFYIVVASQDNKISCRPFPVMVPTDSTNQKFKIVHQCRGSDGEPAHEYIQCVNTTSQPLGIKICGEQVYNHTACKMLNVCKNDQNNVKVKSGVCYFHERWNSKYCKCECKKCDPEKKKTDSSTKRDSSSLLSIDLLLIALVGEFLLLVSIAYIIRRFRRSQKEQTLSVKEGIRFERNDSYSRLSTQPNLDENQ